MLRALYEHGIAPDLIVATSAGALNGAYIASRPPTPQTIEGLVDVWQRARMLSIFPPSPLTALLGMVGQRNHLVPNSGLKHLIARYLEFERLEDAPIPFVVITTDLRTGIEQELTQGDSSQALLAAAAFPGVFPVVKHGQCRLVDGAVADNTPIDDAVERGATTVYVLPTGFSCGPDTTVRGAIPVLVHAITLLVNQRLADDVERFRDQVELILLPPPCPVNIGATDFGHSQQLITESYELAAAALNDPDPAAHCTPQALRRLRPHPH
jgi:NTE family protein